MDCTLSSMKRWTTPSTKPLVDSAPRSASRFTRTAASPSPTTVEEFLRDTVIFMPSSWHYPEITRARIRFEDEEYTSEDFEESEWKQSADIVVAGEVRGHIDVYFTEQRPDRVQQHLSVA